MKKKKNGTNNAEKRTLCNMRQMQSRAIKCEEQQSRLFALVDFFFLELDKKKSNHRMCKKVRKQKGGRSRSKFSVLIMNCYVRMKKNSSSGFDGRPKIIMLGNIL